MTPHPKASEMAKEVATSAARGLAHDSAHIPIIAGQIVLHLLPALTPLLEEIESLKLGQPYEQSLVDMPLDRQIVMLNRQLTATAAKLSEAKEIMMQAHSALDALMGDTDLDDDESPEMKACQSIMAFLSTLQTAETKGGK